MEDVRTRRILDELADLFLTGVAPSSASSPAAPAPEPRPAQRDERVTVGQETSINADALRHALAEEPPGPGVVGRVGSPWMTLEDEFGPDAQAHPASTGPALHLSDESIDTPDIPEETASDRANVVSSSNTLVTEAVLMGNLPGFAGPWLTQYAQYLTRRDASAGYGVAVLHVGAEQLDLEVVYPPGRAVKNLADKDAEPGIAGQLSRLSRTGPAPLRYCLVHLTDAQDPEQRRLAQAIGRWTIVSGADAPAVVGAYKLIKQLRQDDLTEGPEVVQLMVMGADEPEAVEAAERFETTVGNYLGLRAQRGGHVQKMEPVNVHWLGPLAGTSAHWRHLTQQLREVDPTVRPPIGGAAILEPVAAPTSKVEPSPVAAAVTPTVEELPPAPTPEPPSPLAAVEPEPAAEAPAPMPAAMPTPTPMPVVTAPVAESTAPPSLATLLPGSVPLEARSPLCPEVELALDQEGVLHLLHRLEPGRDAGRAVLDLLAVRRWIGEQWSLIKLTQRQCRFREPAEGGQAVPHLITSEPRDAIALAHRLDAAIKVHLLDQVRVGQAVTWYSRALT